MQSRHKGPDKPQLQASPANLKAVAEIRWQGGEKRRRNRNRTPRYEGAELTQVLFTERSDHLRLQDVGAELYDRIEAGENVDRRDLVRRKRQVENAG
jgi:hypothetical protein